ncbi:hypothetical protein FE257_012975 [Aspergillus nanangensis]|uniref:Uncharacterized protein n=1 Tax=Aspergillus nanangensis TaxID=2582783 RepID=A0AAD4GRG7_ASPNN|nr:hypothetical protein FE257_012975 [Aspergillus nanangensis]
MLSFHQGFLDYTTRVYHDSYPAVSTSNHSDRAILITGATGGIGRGIATSFARAGACAIAIMGRNRSLLEQVEKDILQEAHDASIPRPNVLKLCTDTTDSDSVRNAALAVESSFGKLDILVNNAGRMESMDSLQDSDPTDWWRTFEVNIKGTYLVTHSFPGLLLRGHQKTIINISSIAALMQSENMSAYQITKSATLKFSDCIMGEYGKGGIISFCVHPGFVSTNLIGVIPKEETSMFIDSPDLCGDTLAWLTQERREWLAGRLISVNWDMTEFVSRREEIVQKDKLKMQVVL